MSTNTDIDNKAKLLLQAIRQQLRAETNGQMTEFDLDQLSLARAVTACAEAQTERYPTEERVKAGQIPFDATAGIMFATAYMLRASGFNADAARNRIDYRFNEAWGASGEIVKALN